MILTKILINLSICVFLSASAFASAPTQWIKSQKGDRRCSTTCGRYGLDNVLSGKQTVMGDSICAAVEPASKKLVPGVQKLGKKPGCLVPSEKNDIAENADSCLCASDGKPGGEDLAWLDAIENGRCDTTCQKEGYKGFGYAVYSSYVEGSWVHLCMANDGSVGFVGGGKLGCRTAKGVDSKFRCLCTKGYGGDLDPSFDP